MVVLGALLMGKRKKERDSASTADESDVKRSRTEPASDVPENDIYDVWLIKRPKKVSLVFSFSCAFVHFS